MKHSRAALSFTAAILLSLPAGIPFSSAASSAASALTSQSTQKTPRKPKPKTRKMILKGRHGKHHRRPA